MNYRLTSTRPASLSTYEQTHYWVLEFLYDLKFIYKYLVIQDTKTLGLKSKL